nr:wall-associated receptor kinase 2-like [Ziziphus jujuba var. spinosa]
MYRIQFIVSLTSSRLILLMMQLIIFMLAVLSAAAATGGLDPPPGCDRRCGDVDIPYPFGTTEGCALESKFLINCNKSTGDPILGKNLLVTNISIQNHEITIEAYIGKSCYDRKGQPTYDDWSSLTLPFYTVFSSKNKFVVIGCDSYAYLLGTYENDSNSYSTGCTTTCGSIRRVSADGSCSGIGCCQTEIPAGLRSTEIHTYSFNNHTEVKDFNPCTYAFVVEQDKFHFSKDYITNFTQDRQPLVLEWAISNDTCGRNATAYKMDGLSGYYCKCNPGYIGNPYLCHDCQDFNECESSDNHNCTVNELCVNLQGSYTCKPKHQPDQLLAIKLTVGMCCNRPYWVTGEQLLVVLDYQEKS